MTSLEEVADELKPGQAIMHCCAVCKRYGRGVTLINAILPDGQRTQVCQAHIGGPYRRFRK